MIKTRIAFAALAVTLTVTLAWSATNLNSSKSNVYRLTYPTDLVSATQVKAMLVELDSRHPGYGFARHKGYPTPEHFAALARLGPCIAHRRSFAPVAQADLPF